MRRKKWNVEALLSGALALLGFTGCSDINDAPDLYGTPSVDYRVLGTVTDEEGKPLEGIQVVMDNPWIVSYLDEGGKEILPKVDTTNMKILPDTVYTDKKGQFSGLKTMAGSLNKLTVEFRDIDGEANGGEFKSERFTKDKFDKKQLKKGDGFYEGEYEYSKTVKMERK